MRQLQSVTQSDKAESWRRVALKVLSTRKKILGPGQVAPWVRASS